MPESLQFYRDGDCLWITPRAIHTDLEATPEGVALRKELEQAASPRLIVDLSHLSFFGSTVLEFLVLLWRRVGRKQGRLVIFKPSAIGREVLSAARFDRLWPLAETREEALRLAREADREDVEAAD